MDRHPALVKAFRDATLRGLDYSLQHVEEITDLILERYNTQGKSREHLLFEAAQIKELVRPDIVEPGHMSPGRWRHVLEVYRNQGHISSGFELGDFFEPSTPAIPPWLRWTPVLSLSATLLALLFAAKFRAFNLKLWGRNQGAPARCRGPGGERSQVSGTGGKRQCLHPAPGFRRADQLPQRIRGTPVRPGRPGNPGPAAVGP